MLLGQFDSDLLEDLSVVALQGCIESAVTVDDDEAELLIIGHQALQGRGIKLVTTVVERLINGSERLEIIVDLLLGLAVVHEDHTAENDETILGGVLVELQLGAR